MQIPLQLLAFAAELILLINCFAISMELFTGRESVHRLAGFCIFTVGLSALLGSLRYTGVQVDIYHDWLQELSAYFGVVGYVALLAGKLKGDNHPLYLLLLVSVFGYSLDLYWLKHVALVAALLIIAWSMVSQKFSVYHFSAALVGLLIATGVELFGTSPGSLTMIIYQLLLAFSLYQFFRQYSKRWVNEEQQVKLRGSSTNETN